MSDQVTKKIEGNDCAVVVVFDEGRKETRLIVKDEDNKTTDIIKVTCCKGEEYNRLSGMAMVLMKHILPQFKNVPQTWGKFKDWVNDVTLVDDK